MINLTKNFDQETYSEFQKIAHQLLLHCELLVNEKRYALTEIEFYWNTQIHPDGSVYNRIHTGNLKAGKIFVHYSGIDISLDNDFGIGGILIRGIYSIGEGIGYNGPLVCAMKLLSGILDINGTRASIHLVEKPTPLTIKIENTIRKGIGENGKKMGFDKKLYRFVIKYPKGEL